MCNSDEPVDSILESVEERCELSKAEGQFEREAGWATECLVGDLAFIRSRVRLAMHMLSGEKKEGGKMDMSKMRDFCDSLADEEFFEFMPIELLEAALPRMLKIYQERMNSRITAYEKAEIQQIKGGDKNE